MTGLEPSFLPDALAAQSGLLASLLPGSGSAADPALAGLDDLAQANAWETSFLQSELAPQTGAYDSTGTVPADPASQLEQALGGLLSGGVPAGATPDEQLLDGALPAFAYGQGGTLLADSELLGSSGLSLLA